jgi:intracellular sulfur oxidation DsrE/DsrF family protein
MNPNGILMRGLVLGAALGIGAAALPAISAEPAAVPLAGMKEMKIAFDITDANPKVLLNKLEVIDETRQSLLKQGVTPRFVLAFRGEASRFVQTDIDKIKPEDRELAAKVAAKVKALKQAPGVESLEQCSIPLRQREIAESKVIPEIKVVENGWIALVSYQARGYAYIAP